MIEKFTGFYTSRPFWAVSAIDFQDPNSTSHFNALMSEVVYNYSSSTFSFRACRDGMLLLQVHKLENKSPDSDKLDIHAMIQWWGEYLDYFNCLYLLLDSAVINVMRLGYFDLAEVTNKDAFRISFEDGQEKGASVAHQSITSVYQMARYISSYSLPPQYDPRLSMRPVLSTQVFDEVTTKFENIASRKSLVPLLSGIAKGLSEYKIGNYTTSLALAWFVIELILTKKWEELLDSKNQTYSDGGKRISADRKKTLMSRDYPISVISNILVV